MRPSQPFAAAAVAALVLACNEGARPELALRSDSAGIEIVFNTGEDRVLDWTFGRVLSLGGSDAGPESFYRVTRHGVAMDSSGRIYVADMGNKRVHIFDQDGRHVRSFGREGQGPGEFQLPTSLLLEEEGILSVHDPARRSVMRFDTIGTFLDQWSTMVTASQEDPGLVFDPIRADGGARTIAVGRGRPGEASSLTLQRIGASDTSTVAQIQMAVHNVVRYAACSLITSEPALFEQTPVWDARADRLVLADGPEYSIRVFAGDAETRHVHRPIEAEVATREHAVRELGAGRELLVGGRACTIPVDEVIEKRGLGARVPIVARLTVDPDGWLWVERDVLGEDVGPIDIVDETGEYRGTLPAGTPWPLAFGPDDRLLALETDDLDVQRVVVYRIDRP